MSDGAERPSRRARPRGTAQISRQVDAAAVRELLDAEGLPSDDLHAAMLTHFLVCGEPAAPAGVVGLELFDDAALLRSLVVRDSGRRRGTGRALVVAAENAARDAGVHAIYLLTETAEAFFAALGYSPCAREQAPPAIRGTAQFAHLCPDSARLMYKALTRPAKPRMDGQSP